MGEFAGLKLLLDTHIWIWSLSNVKLLSRRTRTALESSSNELWLSPISIWEYLVLTQKGRLITEIEPRAWLKEALERAPMKEAPVSYEIAMERRFIDLSHQDPADRFLAATAKVLDLTLVTADDRLMKSRDFSVLAN
jgi:PIN domain nuclease of toxin-antitoxin system